MSWTDVLCADEWWVTCKQLRNGVDSAQKFKKLEKIWCPIIRAWLVTLITSINIKLLLLVNRRHKRWITVDMRNLIDFWTSFPEFILESLMYDYFLNWRQNNQLPRDKFKNKCRHPLGLQFLQTFAAASWSRSRPPDCSASGISGHIPGTWTIGKTARWHICRRENWTWPPSAAYVLLDYISAQSRILRSTIPDKKIFYTFFQPIFFPKFSKKIRLKYTHRDKKNLCSRNFCVEWSKKSGINF